MKVLAVQTVPVERVKVALILVVKIPKVERMGFNGR
jgi:hypothetical protein